ncbi:hypothetical protein HII13_005419 [Brettanomyces bruxellensis]|nr:hypothetical protein HII13_005419 [Brettanomyces bruxellensis]
MSSIYKLSISGIRSFSDQSQETIQFGKPLTLIVGTNGSGKTTIIECLRYATSSELPPNTRNGASFINDPSLHASNETKAQIKLAFQNVNGVSMILSKNLMAIRNPKSHNTSFKTRENQLMAIRHGERQTISSKMADIESLIPQQLGASKAVLTYVIFCHQEDNLWPISDSSTLKKRFDEIFDSVKFIKVLEELKLTSKQLNVDIKVLTNDVSHLKNDRDRAVSRERMVNQLTSQVTTLEEEMNTLQEQIDNDDRRLDKLYSSKRDYEQTLSKLSVLKQEKLNIQHRIDRIRSTTKILKVPKEVLKSRLNHFSTFLADQNQQVEDITKKIKELDITYQHLMSEYGEKTFEKGKLEGYYQKYKANRNEYAGLISSFQKDVDATAPGELKRFQQFVKMAFESLNSDYQKKMRVEQDKLDQQQETVNELKDKIKEQTRHSEYIHSDRENLKRTCQKMQDKLSELSDNSVRLEEAKSDLVEKEKLLQEFKQKKQISGIASEIEHITNTIRQDEISIDDIHRKMEIVRTNDSISSRKKVLVDMNTKTAKMRELALAKVRSVVTYEKDPDSEYYTKLGKIDIVHTKLSAELEKLKMRKAKLEIGLKSHIDAKASFEKEIKTLEVNFLRSVEEYRSIYNDDVTLDNFEECLQNVADDYNSDYVAMKNHESYVAFNQRAIALADSKNACLLCHREFHGGEKSQFFEILKKQTAKLSHTEEARQLLKNKENVLHMFRETSKTVSRLKQLKNVELGKAQSTIDKLNTEILAVSRDVDSTKEKIEEITVESNRLKSISQDIYNIKHWTEDIEDRKDEITKISEDIVDEGLEYDYDELEKNYKEVEQRIRISRSKLENLRGDKELKTTAFNQMKAAVSELQIKIKNLELKSMDKINIERSVEENKRQIQEMENTLKEAEVEISKIQKKYEENNLELQKMANRIEKEKAESEKSISVLKEYSDKSQILSKDIMDFEENKASTLEKTKEETSALKQKMAEMSSQIEEEESSRRELEKVISDANGQEATISYNLELYSLDDESVSIDEQVGMLDVEKAEAEKSKYVEESQKLQEQQMQHRKEYATRLGQKTQIERQISDIRTEIQRDFKDVNKRYVKQCALLQTKLALVTDLGTCYKATDDGVMKFHHEKMAEINRIIDELWKGTYMGNDVESIMIRADPGASKSRAGTLKTRRSYNYRVVMVKNGVELDMRGRCSAGQKVLASIIIRLALAECFGLNFGMITLDEPTTNLDEENIESLAKALNKIIEMRSVQSNFQLIVITHDEKFLRYMNAVEFTDHYFKVVRDERLHSTINKVKISTLE